MVNKDKEKRFIQRIREGKIEIDPETGIAHSVFRRQMTSKNNGYIQTFCGGETIFVHRLVWMYVYGEIPDGYDINHKNGDKSDNRIDNLELMTRSQNVVHARNVLGRIIGVYGRSFPGSKNGNAKLSWDKIHEIRKMYATGNYTQSDLGKKFGVSQTIIGGIIRNESWIE